MIKQENNKLGLPTYVLFPGEQFVTSENCFLSTITGLCIVVCLYDSRLRLGGMGHFVVPGTLGTEGVIRDEVAEHGIYSLELLMADIVKAGGDRKELTAKIFGTGHLKDSHMSEEIISSNIKFIHDYFKLENIKVEKEDLGGDFRRKIMFKPKTGEAFRKKLKHNEVGSEFIELERQYINEIFENKEIKTNVTLFE